MNEENEWEDQDLPADEPEGDEDGSPDLLAEMDDESRERFSAYLAEREKAAAEAASAEAEKKFRSGMGRWGQASKNLQALGIIVDEHGNVAAQDPAKLAEKFGKANEAPAETPAADDLPDDFAYLSPR